MELGKLTPAEWKMCRQAGAAFADEDTTTVQTAHGQQALIPGVGSQLGDLYRNRHTGLIGCVVKVRQGRYQWVTLRIGSRLTDCPFGWIGVHWDRCRPDGTLL